LDKSYGQILVSNERGSLLRRACLHTEVNSVVEIGTLDATGSTTVIIDALSTKTNIRTAFTTIEAHPGAYGIALKNIKPQPFPVTLLYGCLIHLDSPLLLVGLSEQENFWLKDDITTRIAGVPNVLSQIPEKFDLLVLDGGEFTTFNDYLLLRQRCRFLYLDDCNVRKNRLVLRTAIEDGFKLLEFVDEANGVCLLERA
jgi:hypothetical protein